MITNFKQQRIMKPIYNVWILLFCLTFSSCYDEDIIDPTPDPLALAGGVEFPQGDNPWDNDAMEIYKNFGVKLIYKNIIHIIRKRCQNSLKSVFDTLFLIICFVF